MSVYSAQPMHDTTAPSAIDNWVIAALYQFREVADPTLLQQTLLELTQRHAMCGTLIVAGEGINGTVAGSRSAIDLLHALLLDIGFDALEYKESYATLQPFRRMKVKLKKEIVTLGVEVKPTSTVGHYLNPEEWNALISGDDVLLVDTRNSYEVKAGTFQGAIDPQTPNFRAFPEFIDTHLADKKDKKIAMFCTGGIRCEKSTSLLLQQGFKEVYHLKGGILNYLKTIPPEKSLWQGECFVFDERNTVGYNVNETNRARCFACGWPLTDAEMTIPNYERGVSCLYCFEQTTDEQKARYRMRQQQHDQGHIQTPLQKQLKSS